MTSLLSYPALTGDVVTEGHARICRERGHATHMVDGVDTGMCPRCGEVTIPATTEPAARTQTPDEETAMRVTMHNDGPDSVTMPVIALGTPWHGFAVPMVTATTFRAFVSRMAQVDPNGEWSDLTVSETTYDERSTLTLTHAHGDGRNDYWHTYNVTANGEPIYTLDGWVWESVDNG